MKKSMEDGKKQGLWTKMVDKFRSLVDKMKKKLD